MYSRIVNSFSATRLGSWFVKHVFSPIDPIIFMATNGRLTLSGKPTLPMVTMTALGRKSAKPRSVQLAYHADGDDLLIVASAMGQEHHPAWSYNIEANPEVEIQGAGDRYKARAERLTDAEKVALWPHIKRTIPQMNTYEARTRRNIRVFRLRRIN
jgi:deazaflavin-dependent oxidoreductase (nitroreductase family)